MINSLNYYTWGRTGLFRQFQFQFENLQKQIISLDSNVFIITLHRDERERKREKLHTEKYHSILRKVFSIKIIQFTFLLLNDYLQQRIFS